MALAEISNDIDTLYGKVNKLTEQMAEVKSAHGFFKEMLQKNTETNEKLANTLSDMQVCMTRLNDKMDANTESLQIMKQDSENGDRQINEKITELTDKVNSIEEKGKFDIRVFIKENFPWIVVMFGTGMLWLSDKVSF